MNRYSSNFSGKLVLFLEKIRSISGAQHRDGFAVAGV
jgi:hypothetical protein